MMIDLYFNYQACFNQEIIVQLFMVVFNFVEYFLYGLNFVVLVMMFVNVNAHALLNAIKYVNAKCFNFLYSQVYLHHKFFELLKELCLALLLYPCKY
jgi:hypothetical protein